MAYLRVHSRANSLYFSLSVLYILAISGTSGSSGFGSHSKEHIDSNTGKWSIIVRALFAFKPFLSEERGCASLNAHTSDDKKTRTFWYSECGRPLRSQDIQTNTSVTVDIGMIDSSCKCHLSSKNERQSLALILLRFSYNQLISRIERFRFTCRISSYLGRFERVICWKVYC